MRAEVPPGIKVVRVWWEDAYDFGPDDGNLWPYVPYTVSELVEMTEDYVEMVHERLPDGRTRGGRIPRSLIRRMDEIG